jgi:hypothetical protein
MTAGDFPLEGNVVKMQYKSINQMEHRPRNLSRMANHDPHVVFVYDGKGIALDSFEIGLA